MLEEATKEGMPSTASPTKRWTSSSRPLLGAAILKQDNSEMLIGLDGGSLVNSRHAEASPLVVKVRGSKRLSWTDLLAIWITLSGVPIELSPGGALAQDAPLDRPVANRTYSQSQLFRQRSH